MHCALRIDLIVDAHYQRPFLDALKSLGSMLKSQLLIANVFETLCGWISSRSGWLLELLTELKIQILKGEVGPIFYWLLLAG